MNFRGAVSSARRFVSATQDNVRFLVMTTKEPVVIALAVAAGEESDGARPQNVSFSLSLSLFYAIITTHTVTNPSRGIGSVAKSRRFCHAILESR